jgi:ribonuclease E
MAAQREDLPPPETQAYTPPMREPAARPEPAMPAPAMPAPAVPAEAEQPRRRSTVREPAPIFGVSQPSASSPSPASVETRPPAPAETAPAADEAEKPTKRGWWRRG